MKRFLFNIVFFTLVCSIHAHIYLLIFDDERVFKPCEGEEDNFISNWLDLSNVTYEFIDENEIVIDGTFIGICPAPKDSIPNLEVRLHRMVRGKYGLPVIQINRKNLCTSLFSPKEVWYQFMDQIDMEHRTCPSVPGTKYPFHNYSTKDIKVSLPDPHLAGSYRVIIRSTFLDNKGPPFCLFVDFRLYRA